MSDHVLVSSLGWLRLIFQRTAKVISVILVSIISVAIVVSVIFRYGLNNALPWPENLAVMLLVWITFIGGSAAYFEREHVNITYLYDKMPSPLATGTLVLSESVILMFALGLVYFGYGLAISRSQYTSEVLGISLFWGEIPMVIAGVFIATEAIGRIVDALASSPEGSQ